MPSLFRQLVAFEKYCCPWAYVKATQKYVTIDFAEKHLGVSDRTLRYWRLKVRRGKIKCERCTTCRHPQKTG